MLLGQLLERDVHGDPAHPELYPTISFFGLHLSMPLGHWINDALMAIFFFVVWMEINRYIVFFVLSDLQRAFLPLIFSLGGA